MFVANSTTVFRGRNSSVNARSVTLKTCYNPIYRSTAEDFPLDFYSFLPYEFQGSFWTLEQKNPRLTSHYLRECYWNIHLQTIFLSVAQQPSPSFIFAALRRGNFLDKYKNASPVTFTDLSRQFHYCSRDANCSALLLGNCRSLKRSFNSQRVILCYYIDSSLLKKSGSLEVLCLGVEIALESLSLLSLSV